ncbi:hypothetical protein BGZ60DRAFT_390609 [Tricladium varicosporioides]|nr:hypothetical protein BGZ60DRAFT_390609 [Hymenoscyphus varicosporioides]
MVALSEVQVSNSHIAIQFPQPLVGIFVGGTGGIGEITLKKFAKYCPQPRAYIIGRSQEASERIIDECKSINPNGQYLFFKEDVSLIKNVDKVCAKIAAAESAINILFLSAGSSDLNHNQTPEGLHLLAALPVYGRFRFIQNLAPLLQNATALHRVVTVAGGGKEGRIDTSDFQALRAPFYKFRGHLVSIITLGLEKLEKDMPEVSFVHDFPGAVHTSLIDNTTGFLGVLLRVMFFLLGWWICVPIDESGERHLYLATSARFPPAQGTLDAKGVKSETGVCKGSTGDEGSGVYSVGQDCDALSPARMKVLAGMRQKGMVEEIWAHVQGEFDRISEKNT